VSTPDTQPAVTQPYEEDLAERQAADLGDEDLDTVLDTRPLPDTEMSGPSQGRPELLPSIGHIGRYALKYVIGEGGLGTVYAAHDPLLSRLIAIKTLNVDLPADGREQFNALFQNEAKAAGSLSHPHIVTTYDAGTSEQGAYIAMELLRGKDLRQLLALGWRPTPAQAALIVRRVADALSYAHHKGVIHRDIKPANIFMVGRTQPRVLDFGIARIRQAESLAQRDDPQSRFQEMIGGSPYYMAPEMVKHQPVDRRADVYALGVVLHELLVGQRAFGGDSLEAIADEVLSKAVPLAHELNPAVSLELSEIVARAMQRDPDQRTKSARRLAGELRDWLRSVGADQGQAKATRLPGQVAMRRNDWRPMLWTLAGAGWVAALVVGGWMFWTSRTTPQESPPVAQAASAVVAVQPPATATVQAADEPALPVPVPVPSAVPAPAASASVAAPASTSVAAPAAALAVASNATAPAVKPAPPLAKGSLRLSVEPWAEVWVDGQSVGLTPPLKQLTLSAGTHRVELRNGDLAPHTVTVDVPAGKFATVRHRF
jgi:hypothetical protein